MYNRLTSLLLAILLFASAPAGAEGPKPAFLQPDVLKAALAINLTDEQKPVFRDAITAFAQSRIDALGKLMRGNQRTGIDRRWKSKTRAILKEMDDTLRPVLTEDQWPAYEDYREALKANLRGL
ncbi:MAG: hypothetical protein P8L31_06710 [Pseudomonadales bacterium]|nr:hypothetical protein [Pseudomonadales bacterium]